jgi:hypothetical protein
MGEKQGRSGILFSALGEDLVGENVRVFCISLNYFIRFISKD